MSRREQERRLATLVGGGRAPVRWELLEPGRRVVVAAIELCAQLSQGLPEGEGEACREAAEQLRQILHALASPAASAVTGRRRPRRDEQELPPGDRAARVA